MLIKKNDHLERANRKSEIIHLIEDYKNQQKLDKETYEAKCKADLKASKLQFEKDMEIKSRLKVMHDDYLSYKKNIMKKREEEFKIKKAEMDIKMEEAKKKRREEHNILLVEREKKEKEEAARNLEKESNCFLKLTY